MRIEAGDCLEVMAALIAEGVQLDSVVTDPPYHLTSIVKRFGGKNAAAAQHGSDGLYSRASAGFMGKQWDGGDIAFRPDTWRLVYALMKPGAHLVAFGGTRGYHRMACAIEDAGFEIRDSLMWLYGSGFPKSHNAGNGWGTALKPAYEPIVLARKPLIGTVAENVLQHGTGAINIDGCRVAGAFESGLSKSGSKASKNVAMSGANYAREPLPDNASGRWPANILHDGSEEVLAGFPNSESTRSEVTSKPGAIYGNGFGLPSHTGTYGFNDSGSAARFFYSSKADKDDRWGSKHPTVKPVDLMAWLVRLITPPGGTVMDPFAGSGSTGIAAMREGMNAILIEREAEYLADIKERIAAYSGEGGHSQASKHRKVNAEQAGGADMPLFGGSGTNNAGGGRLVYGDFAADKSGRRD